MPIEADAVPDPRPRRLQVLLAARGGCREKLAGRLQDEADRASKRFAPPAQVTVLVQLDDDPFPAANPLLRPYDAVLEVESSSSASSRPSEAVAAFGDAVDGIGKRLADVVHVDLSAALVGAPQTVIPCDPTPVRYLYLMRRKAGTSREQYIDHYFHHHSRFGFVTPGIDGYTQFHVDLAASEAIGDRLGLGIWAFDSVSELYLQSLAEFLDKIADGRVGAEPLADEMRFVDRDNSVSFCTRVACTLDVG